VDPATLIGITLGIVSLLALMIMEGSSPLAIILLPPLILVFGGTFGAAIAGSAMADVKKIGAWFKMALMPAKVPPVSDRIATLVGLAEKARKEGLLALEAQVKAIDDPFLKRGLQMGIDGTDPEELRAVLEGEITAKKGEDKVAAKFFTAMGGYAPTIGIIGTVVGLIHVLENLSSPESLGPLIASAFVATLWGCPLGQPLLAAHGREDHADQRAAGRADGAPRRGHHRDPGRHQPPRRPAEADRPRAAE
jgi:chemotaxis protein MotA